MPIQIRTAVAAAAAENVRRALPRLLAHSGIELLSMSPDAASAFHAVRTHRPDLLIADLELPQMDGAALALHILHDRSLPVRPATIVLRYPEFPVPNAPALESSGILLLDKPLASPAFCASIDLMRSRAPVFHPTDELRTDSLLDELGVPAHPGRDCLKLAVLLCASDERLLHRLTPLLYPEIGRLLSRSAEQIERSLRHVINLAWQSDKFENQYRIFADTVDARRGQPTCGEMISRLADILRLEG